MTKNLRKNESIKKDDPVYWDNGSNCATSRNTGTVLMGHAESDSKNGSVKIKPLKEEK